jgi:hypothetical protein
LSNTLNYREALKSEPSPNLTIVMVYLDSMSRSHFFRKLPKSVDYLNSIKSDSSSDYSVFDFKMFNIIGEDTKNN